MMNDIEALKIAVERESLSRYLQFARKTKDMSDKNMFIRLATDELSALEPNLRKEA
jgi:rubrerythrin